MGAGIALCKRLAYHVSMLDRQYIRQNPEEAQKKLTQRNSKADVSVYLALDEKRRQMLTEVEEKKHEKNKASKAIGELKKAGQDAGVQVTAMKAIGTDIADTETGIAVLEKEMKNWELSVPNLADGSVPVGRDESANKEIRTWGDKKKFDFEPKPHWEVGKPLGLDMERASKLTGARFVVLKGGLAKLERALINFMLDLQTDEHGYQETVPPFMVNEKALTGTGQLPKFEKDLFKLREFGYYLIPTAEVPLTNLHAGEILFEKDLPLYYTAVTPCFRSEAGSYGKDTRGIIRLHQFNKVELVKITDAESSFDELEKLTANAEEVLKRLELPYRVVLLSSGDMGFGSAKTYDLEVWCPGEGTFKEISSCSNCTDFQARRANIRYRGESGGKDGGGAKKVKPRFCHTLNGSGLAVGRTMAALLENYQNADGTVTLPEALRSYMGGMERLEPA